MIFFYLSLRTSDIVLGGGGTHFSFQHLDGRSLNWRPAWSIKHIPGHLRLYRESLLEPHDTCQKKVIQVSSYPNSHPHLFIDIVSATFEKLFPFWNSASRVFLIDLGCKFLIRYMISKYSATLLSEGFFRESN